MLYAFQNLQLALEVLCLDAFLFFLYGSPVFAYCLHCCPEFGLQRVNLRNELFWVSASFDVFLVCFLQFDVVEFVEE